MAKIIVGVDFSEGTEMAIDLAVDLAKRFGAGLRFVGVNEENLSDAALRGEIARREKIREEMLRGLEVEYVPMKGDVTEVLCEQARLTGASLIVVGTHGTAGLQKRLFGKDSYALVSKSPAPVLCVREDFDYHPDFKDILVPIDASDASRQKIPMAMRLAKAYGSTLHLLGLYDTQMAEVRATVKNYTLQSKNLLDSHGVSNTVKMVDVVDGVPKTILDYAQQVCADLMILMSESSVSIASLLAGSDDQRTIMASRIPILTVRAVQLHSFYVK